MQDESLFCPDCGYFGIFSEAQEIQAYHSWSSTALIRHLLTEVECRDCGWSARYMESVA